MKTLFQLRNCLLIVAMALSLSHPVQAGSPDEMLRNALERYQASGRLSVGTEPVYAARTLHTFYERRGFVPAWTSGPTATSNLDALMSAVQSAHAQGLRPSDYHLERLRELLKRLQEKNKKDTPHLPAMAAEIDLLATDAFLMLGSHYLAGRTNPETYDSEWYANRRNRDMAAHLEVALNQQTVGQALASLLPAYPDYADLVAKLAELRALQSKTPDEQKISYGSNLSLGSTDERVGEVRSKLKRAGYLSAGAGSGKFDAALEAAVRAFQRDVNLNDTGVVDTITLAELNKGTAEQIEQILVNLERWRWMPNDLGKDYVWVNIAGFDMGVVKNGTQIFESPVAVGSLFNKTPIFSDQIRYLVLNPSWEVPASIIKKDRLPAFKADPAVISRDGFSIIQGWGSNAKVIDPKTINWSTVDPETFPYRVRQAPGPLNALGRVKFMFPNKFNVYLHDTASKGVFARVARTGTSGCVRIEKPIELASTLLADTPGWDTAKINQVIAAGTETTVNLSAPIPVHVLYWTAFKDRKTGKVRLISDTYLRDKAVLRALTEPAPSS